MVPQKKCRCVKNERIHGINNMKVYGELQKNTMYLKKLKILVHIMSGNLLPHNSYDYNRKSKSAMRGSYKKDTPVT